MAIFTIIIAALILSVIGLKLRQIDGLLKEMEDKKKQIL